MRKWLKHTLRRYRAFFPSKGTSVVGRPIFEARMQFCGFIHAWVVHPECDRHSDSSVLYSVILRSSLNGSINSGCVLRTCVGAVGKTEVREFVSAEYK